MLANKVVEILTNARFTEGMGAMQTAAAASGGSEAAASAVEEAFLRADDQADLPTITDLDYRDKMRATSAIKYNCFCLFMLALISYLIYVVTEFYRPVDIEEILEEIVY